MANVMIQSGRREEDDMKLTKENHKHDHRTALIHDNYAPHYHATDGGDAIYSDD